MDETKFAFLFPGQGSQLVGMGNDLARVFPIARETFEQADEILGFSLSKVVWEGPEDLLNDTINTQPALLVHSVAALRVFQQLNPGCSPLFVAGHSMGELSSLVAAEVLPYPDALHLVRIRGKLMKQAGEISSGGMAAILGLDISVLEQICTQASTSTEIVQVANDNCPGQVVISGASAALDRALSLSQQAGARRSVRLAVSIAAHSPLMAHAQVEFNRAVNTAPIKKPALPLVGNVTAKALHTTEEIKADLEDQLTHRVRWTESIQWMVSQGIKTFYELGSGSVLTGLLKRIDRQVNGIPLGSPVDFSK